MAQRFTKVFIANRGAIARRIVRACSELGLETVAAYSEADRDAPHLAEASESAALRGMRAEETYLNREALLAALETSGADALHPGYGFLAENADFAEQVLERGAAFVGPSPKWLRAMGDKAAALALMADKGFPVLNASAAFDDRQLALAAAERIGYPVMLKAVGGGGGIGMRICKSAAELTAGYGPTRLMAQHAFDDTRLYVEQWLDKPRHIEVQLLADGKGNALHVYERECSIQRRHQKLVEESPAPGIDRASLIELCETAERTVAELGYDNVGTLETLLSTDGGFGFLEMNTRIQVEHGVTEEVTGLDLVQTQIKLAQGDALPERPALAGHAIEVRVYAEDSQRMYASTGRLTVFRPPNMFGVRVETGYQEGQLVTPYYDALLAKLIGVGSSREQALGRVLVGLKGFVVRGVKTNIALLQRILQDAEFIAGKLDTGFIERLMAKNDS
ncbi:MAG: biotin carboxylase N-terminal domain-containing protein [Pseudomonadales bacterium]